jgi:hypothetical protein
VSVPAVFAAFSETASGGGVTTGIGLIWQLDRRASLGLVVDHCASSEASCTLVGSRLDWG